jgi:glc operon protein GlcG
LPIAHRQSDDKETEMMNTPTFEKKVLTEAGADIVAQAAEAEAKARGVAPVIAVVDEHGTLITMRRPDNAQIASVNVAIDKARTAAIFRRPSKDFEDQTRNGRVAALALHGAVALQGGVPLLYDGQVVGAIGVSGASSADEDSELATIGAQAAKSFRQGELGTADVFYADGDIVAAKFQTGGLLLNVPEYKIDAGRRERPGEVEFHTWETDIMYVLDGEATVVTGGEMVDRRQVGPGEYRATSVRGGTTHSLSRGDVLAIPNGVPHWFKDVSGPFLYYVVKVIQSH